MEAVEAVEVDGGRSDMPRPLKFWRPVDSSRPRLLSSNTLFFCSLFFSPLAAARRNGSKRDKFH